MKTLVEWTDRVKIGLEVDRYVIGRQHQNDSDLPGPQRLGRSGHSSSFEPGSYCPFKTGLLRADDQQW